MPRRSVPVVEPTGARRVVLLVLRPRPAYPASERRSFAAVRASVKVLRLE
jgi:hypothetical protein